MIREAIANHTGNALPEEPPLPPARAFGPVHLTERAALMESLPLLAPGDGIPAFKPAPMESYGQPYAPFPPPSNSWPDLEFILRKCSAAKLQKRMPACVQISISGKRALIVRTCKAVLARVLPALCALYML